MSLALVDRLIKELEDSLAAKSSSSSSGSSSKSSSSSSSSSKSSSSSSSSSTSSSSSSSSNGENESFPKLDADEALKSLSVMESLCIRCEQQGETRMLTTKIPYFRDIILCSFSCPHCGYSNNQVEPANELAEKGCVLTLSVNAANPEETKKDLNRQVIRSEHARVLIPAIEFEGLPSASKKGDINTLEGILVQISDNLQSTYIENTDQTVEPDVLIKFVAIVAKLKDFAQGKDSFEFLIDDPSGNSYIENPCAPATDPRVKTSHYERTREMTESMGYKWAEESEDLNDPRVHLAHATKHVEKQIDTYFDVTNKQAELPGICHSCSQPNITRMCVVEIPHFKDVIIMSTQCDFCGYKDSEVKPGGSVSRRGLRATLKVVQPSDLARDLLKSDGAGVYIPELDLELTHGTLGGKYTTVEGLLEDIRRQLMDTSVFQIGDSSDEEDRKRVGEFLEKFDLISRVAIPWTLMIDDPLGNVFIHNPHYPQPDPNLVLEEYERTEDMEEELGLHDMRTEHYNLDEEGEHPEEEEQEQEDHYAGTDLPSDLPQPGVVAQMRGTIGTVDHPYAYTPPQTVFSQENKAAAEAALGKGKDKDTKEKAKKEKS